jgi:hypothetical protein
MINNYFDYYYYYYYLQIADFASVKSPLTATPTSEREQTVNRKRGDRRRRRRPSLISRLSRFMRRKPFNYAHLPFACDVRLKSLKS